MPSPVATLGTRNPGRRYPIARAVRSRKTAGCRNQATHRNRYFRDARFGFTSKDHLGLRGQQLAAILAELRRRLVAHRGACRAGPRGVGAPGAAHGRFLRSGSPWARPERPSPEVSARGTPRGGEVPVRRSVRQLRELTKRRNSGARLPSRFCRRFLQFLAVLSFVERGCYFCRFFHSISTNLFGGRDPLPHTASYSAVGFAAIASSSFLPSLICALMRVEMVASISR